MNPSPELDLYRTFHPLRISLGDGKDLVSLDQTRAAVVVDAMEADLLTTCGTFRTLPDHANELVRAGSLEAEVFAPILYQLAQLARSKLLISRSSLVERMRAGARSAEPPPSVTTLGILTHNRPEALARCLESYLLNFRQHSRELRCVVMDDSDPASAKVNRARLADLKSRFGARIFYAGSAEKERFIQVLVDEGARPEDVRFALSDPEGCRITTGANRNALLLETLGEMIVSVDDDTVCRMAKPPLEQAGLSLSSEPDPTEFWFYPDRTALLAATRLLDFDFAGAHESLLGRSLAACAQAPEDVDFDRMDARLLRRVEAEDGRVLVTMNGIFGDSGMGGNGGYLTLEGPSRERFVASESAYRSALTSRDVMRCALRPTIVNRPFLMTPGAGFDNRDLLPPFMPVMRNQDGVFGLALRQGWERSSIGHLPWMLFHDPVEARNASASSRPGVDSYDLVLACMGSVELGQIKADGEPRLRALGRHLVDLASLGPGRFEDAVRRLLFQRAEGSAGTMYGQLEEYGRSPDYWAEDVRKALDGLLQNVSSEDFPTPRDLQTDRTSAKARELGRRLILRYGMLMEAWPDLVQAARRARARGRALAQPI